MRPPLDTALSAEDRSLTRRWAIAVTSFYSTIVMVIVAAALVSSTADKVTAVASSGPQHVSRNQPVARPYGSLPNLTAACAPPQPCMELARSH
jgi:predicted PurR-regulated permease PerM